MRHDPPSVLGRDERATPAEGGPRVPVAIAESARAALSAAGIALADVVAAGCASPGPLDHRSGVVHQAPNIRGFHEFPLGASVSEALGGLRVFVDRDTVMAAIAEGLAGAARGSADFVYVTVSTGIGGAIVSGGRLLRGASGTAGEVGHWPVALEGPPCGCFSSGCVESLAGGRNLAKAFGVTDARQVFAAVAAGDERAWEIVARAEAALANLAVGLVNALNPSRIVVGGSIAEHEPGHVLEPMRRAIAARAFTVPARAVEVVPSAFGGEVGMLGAVLAARDRATGHGEWFM